MKWLDNIRSLDTGVRKIPMTPISPTIRREVEYREMEPLDQQKIIRHELAWRAQSMMPAHDQGTEIENENKVRWLIADAVYGEVIDDIHEILLWAMENIGSRELEDKLLRLVGKMRGETNETG